MNQQKIGRFIKELRREKSFTQEQLAETLGVSSRSISRWENGINMPDFDIVIQLADFFDISIEELFDGEKKEEKMDKEKEDTMLKVSEYENEQKLKMSRKLRWLFIGGIVANLLSAIIETQGLANRPMMDAGSRFLDGFQFGILVIGLLFTTKYINKIQAFKQRLLKR